MQDASQAATPKPRWYRRRKPQFLLVLLVGCVAAFFAWDALFMSADLRRLQGSWKLVKCNEIADPAVEVEIGKVLKIENRTVRLHFQPDEPMLIELNGNRFFLYDLADTERTILGFKVRVPTWLKRPKDYVHGVFECDDRHLMLWIKGEINEAVQPLVQEQDRGEKWFLERE